VLLGLAHCRYQAGHLQEAEQLLTELLSYQPRLAAALRELGHIALDSGRLDEARRRLDEALARDPFERDTLFFLYRCCQQQGEKARADEYVARFKKVEADLLRLQKLAQLVMAKPTDPELRYEAGMICMRNGQEQEALRWFTGALQVCPDHAPTVKVLADFYKRTGQAGAASTQEQQHAASRK
jgi:predicted Zn-dependent protease